MLISSEKLRHKLRGNCKQKGSNKLGPFDCKVEQITFIEMGAAQSAFDEVIQKTISSLLQISA